MEFGAKCFLLVFAIFVSGCSSVSQVKPMQASLAEDHIPLEEETWARKQADYFHSSMTSKGLIIRNPEVQQLVDDIKNRLLANSPELQSAIRAYVVRAPDVNAMALPNGVIYMQAGLFTVVETEDEFAAILSHEISHIVQQHSVKSIISKKNTLIGAQIADFATAGIGIAFLPAVASIMSFSQGQEKEADQLGTERLTAAGYAPEAMASVFRKMQALPELKHVEYSIYSSHPSQAQRINELEARFPSSSQESDLPPPGDAYKSVRASMIERTIKMRIKARQYALASYMLDDESNLITSESMRHFYQGEVYWGYARNPNDAANEKAWLDDGKTVASKDQQKQFQADKQKNIDLAIEHYQQAVASEQPYVKSYRRLGDIAKQTDDTEKAIAWYQEYLTLNPQARDRKYVERMLQKLNDEI